VLELEEKGFSLASVNYFWLAMSGVFYGLGMIPSWWFWHTTLHAMRARPTWRESCRAFFIGHLGKYVPGKALVVVIRAGMVRSRRTDTTVAAVAVFIETLTLMAVGATLAAALIAFNYREQHLALVVSIGIALCAGIPTLPPIFRSIVRLLKVKKANPQIDQALAGVDYRLMGLGWLALTIECFGFGLSLWATLQAIPTLSGGEVELVSLLPLLTATVTIAMVAGFVSLLPGGMGVREFLIVQLLTTSFTAAAAVVAAGLLRIAWLLTEVVISIILYLAIRPPADVPSAPTPSADKSS
jgi:uncharacterized membrane protein YbhN (UPF0104 family)